MEALYLMKQIPHDWTEARVKELKRLFDEGVSFSHIASQLALTCSSVIGKCHRLGLRRGPPVTARLRSLAAKSSHIRRPRSDSTKNKTFNRIVAPKFSSEPLPSPAESDLAIPRRRRKNIFNLGPRDCKFPVGDPGTPSFFFCGVRKLDLLPYCAEHARRCFVPAKRP
jgi:GcrA cell cycle regulator